MFLLCFLTSLEIVVGSLDKYLEIKDIIDETSQKESYLQKKEYYLNRNVKMHPLLNALTWDVVFVWTISTIFLSNVKGLSYSQIVFLDSILMFAGCVFCIPIQKLFKNVIPKIALRIGLVCYAGFLLLLMVGRVSTSGFSSPPNLKQKTT